MSTTNVALTVEMIERHTEKLKYWFDLLKEIMPEYFFNTFSPQQIQEILPALFNIHRNAGIQQITSDNYVILIYLQSEAINLVTTARMMKDYKIFGASIHKSTQQIVIEGVPRTLVIEHYKTGQGLMETAPAHSKKDVAHAYKKAFGGPTDDVEEMYGRLNWEAVSDLSLDRLVGRMHCAIRAQQKDCVDVEVEKAGKDELRLTMSFSNCPEKGFYFRIIECLALNGLLVSRAYLRNFTRQDNPNDFSRMPVAVNTLYLEHDKKAPSISAKKIAQILWELPHVKWVDMDDVIHSELVVKKGWALSEANLIRAAGEFVHSQFSFVDRNAYNSHDILRLMALYEPVARGMWKYFEAKFAPEMENREKKCAAAERQTLSAIKSINTGVREKDELVKNILNGVMNFLSNILKTNYYVKDKMALSFRLDPRFMVFYEGLAESYKNAFPKDRPFGVFYFYNINTVGFQVRFSDIARGGWRTVIPRLSGHELERTDVYGFTKDEIFKEVYVLAHTQHMKNKDIYEGGAKMICLIKQENPATQKACLFESQRCITRAFLHLINYDAKGKLKAKEVLDYLRKHEIIEIGPDENMFDLMIEWMSDYAEKVGYTLGGGLISGKPETGVNHKDYGVTSFGVHQYLIKTLAELGVNPAADQFTIKISGGPFGDVAGNEILLLLKKENGKFIYPNLKIVAMTDGPAAAFDPEGLDKEELLRLAKAKNLDSFDPEKLKGEGAYMIFSETVMEDGVEKNLLVSRKGKSLTKKRVSRDEYMRIFQDNLMANYADIFIPCGGRPSTISMSNWQDYMLPDGRPSSKAIVEGANSFITPDARNMLQSKGVWIVKDASANKCGVITSSYEILSGLMLDKSEFLKMKSELVKEIMEILRTRAQKEADWLFLQYHATGSRLTDLTEQLSREINDKNVEILNHLEHHPQLVRDDIILDHLPALFRKLDKGRVDRLPSPYKKAIVAVELASRIVFSRTKSIAEEIQSVLKK